MVGSLTVSTTLVHVVLGIHCTPMEGTVKIVSEPRHEISSNVRQAKPQIRLHIHAV